MQILPTAESERDILIDEQGTITYIGVAALGSSTSEAVWQIRRISLDGTLNTFKYANGSRRFNQIWDNRASLTYT